MAQSTEHYLNVKYNSSQSIRIKFDPDWTIKQLKEEISKRVNVPQKEIRIIFQGRELADIVKIKHSDLGNNSTLNCVKGERVVNLEASTRLGTLESIAGYEEDPDPTGPTSSSAAKKPYFYIYCKENCQAVKRGKLRVRCKKCLEGHFEVETEPNCYADVTEPDKIYGKCHTARCSGKIADFYFKCSVHEGAGESPVLPLVRTNTKDIECAVCEDIMDPVVVFPCSKKHVICLTCFGCYCQVNLNDRAFRMSKDGYTLPCAGGSDDCDAALITNTHHFLIIGQEQYERYKRFATEEFVLRNKGVLCANVDCGAALLPDDVNMRKITCEKQGSHGCGFTFCRQCKEPYHDGECGIDPDQIRTCNINDSYRLDPVRAEQSRWDRDCRETIEKTTKPCPECKVPIERNAGCMHMTCTRCRFQWCWLCSIEWSGKCQGDHWFGE